jgi:alpha-ketoglutarate-dependent 2,4-dichlorophenoxyacetate dioxygenase
MAISVKALHTLFVGEIHGPDLRDPVDQPTLREIVQALDHYAVLVFRDQPLTDNEQIAFSGLFGPLETAVGSMRCDRKSRLGNRRLADVSNLDENNNIRSESDSWRRMQLANQLWHTDSSFKTVPGMLSFLSARELPPSGGETEFADMRAAYDGLDTLTQDRIRCLEAEHSLLYSRSLTGYDDFTDAERAAFPPVSRSLVRVHPGSGRKTLYLASHASRIIGWPAERGRALLASLIEGATRPQFVYRHDWQLNDLVVWDNRCTMHRARPYDDVEHRRDMRRTTVADTDFTSMASAQCATP